MQHLEIIEQPQGTLPTLVISFAGWSDAAQAATYAVRFLIRKLQARLCARIDPEEFYDFTHIRPITRLNRAGERIIEWPSNEFFYASADQGHRGLLLFVGIEPNLRWRTFANTMMDLATQCSTSEVAFLGALVDAVPHTREPRVTGSATKPEWQHLLEELRMRASGYQGPTGIGTAIIQAARGRGLSYASIWGHTPHYLQVAPNPQVSYTILRRLATLLDLSLDLAELHAAAQVFQEQCQRAMASEPGLQAYLAQLEEQYDRQMGPPSDIPPPQELLQDLEEFLKQQREQRGDGPPPQG